jgi:hypothetical protein
MIVLFSISLAGDPFQAFLDEILLFFTGTVGLIKGVITVFSMFFLINGMRKVLKGQVQDGVGYFFLMLIMVGLLASLLD